MNGADRPWLAIFDHDGVLVDTLEFHIESWLEMGRREGLDVTPEFVRATFGLPNGRIIRRLLGEDIDPALITRYADLKEECYREIARGRIQLMPGVRELLDGLVAAGAKLAIGSSAPRLNLELTVSECGLEGRFAAIVPIEDITHGKPDPEVFLRAAERVEISPARAVVFEDAVVGIQAAKAAGMWAVGVGTTRELEALWQAGADDTVPSVLEYSVSHLAQRMAGRT